jgi:hypothetical protein
MTNQEQPKEEKIFYRKSEASKYLKNEGKIEQQVREYDQAILDAKEKYKVMNVDLIELKDGKITIGGLDPEAWESLHNTSDTDYRKGQR